MNSPLEEAARLMMELNYDEAIELLKTDTSPKGCHMLATCYFLTGEFEKTYKTFKQLREITSEAQYLKDAEKFIGVFEGGEFHHSLPQPNQKDYPQSIERSDESYEELDILKKFQNIEDLVDYLNKRIGYKDYEKSANAMFCLGQIAVNNGSIEKGLEYYFKAISKNPNKALYFGYYAQFLYRQQQHAFETARFCDQAIKLDPQNARWHYIKGLNLASAAVSMRNNVFLLSGLKNCEKALELCRSDQVSFKKAIQTACRSIEDGISASGIKSS